MAEMRVLIPATCQICDDLADPVTRLCDNHARRIKEYLGTPEGDSSTLLESMARYIRGAHTNYDIAILRDAHLLD